jgi:hypothetical protein
VAGKGKIKQLAVGKCVGKVAACCGRKGVGKACCGKMRGKKKQLAVAEKVWEKEAACCGKIRGK